MLNFDNQLKTQEALPLRTPTPPSVIDGPKSKISPPKPHPESESSENTLLHRRPSRNRTLANIHEEDVSMIIEVKKDKLTSNVPLPSKRSRGRRNSDSESDEDYSDRKNSLLRNRKRSISQSSGESDNENRRGKKRGEATSRKGRKANNQTIAEESDEEDSDQFGLVDLENHK